MHHRLLLVQAPVKVPFSIVIALIFSMMSLTVSIALAKAKGADWLDGALPTVMTMLFAIFWPSWALGVFRRLLDDRHMTCEEVEASTKGAFPSLVLRVVYRVAAVIEMLSLLVSFFLPWFCVVSASEAQGDIQRMLAVDGSLAGLVSSVILAILLRKKDVVTSRIFATIGSAFAVSAAVHLAMAPR
ncbi:MAG TPA: hypothetical protein VGN46_04310 [Luteibacter sp.]|jgi:hypothetical protein|uniref:hypothetical protein n=1 Tax=Luteibacter sp. TaxID=1886636 RepID=UPI002F423068